MSPIKVDAKHLRMGQVPTRGGSVNIDGKRRKCWRPKSNVYDTHNTIKTFQKTNTTTKTNTKTQTKCSHYWRKVDNAGTKIFL